MNEAKRLSAHAVELAGRTDWLTDHADALLSHAEVLRAAGEADAATRSIRDALALFERKGNEIGAQRAREALAIGVLA
jgi:hypothetical protein